MIKRLAWILGFGLASVSLIAADVVERKLDPSLKLLYRAKTGAGSVGVNRALCSGLRVYGPSTTYGSSDLRLPLLVKYAGDPGDLKAIGFEMQAKAGPIVTGYLPADRITDLAKLPGLHYAQLSQMLWASRPKEMCLEAGDPSPGRSGGYSGRAEDLSGTGVLVAFIDTGVDVFHEDFRKADTDKTTRIKYLLDFSDPGDTDGDGDLDGTGPFGGTLYTEAEINAALVAGTFASKDTTGHGTHGLSVAAGDDPALPGVAPAADLLVVKATREDGALGFWSVDIVNALSFVDQKAGELGQPYVANLSLGSIFSSHDGRSLEEQAVDAIIGPGIAGKAVVIAAGNSSDNRGTRYHHFSDTAYVGISKTHTLTVPAYTPSQGNGNDRVLFDLWFEGNDQTSITVTSPNGHSATATYGDYTDQPTADGDIFIANMGGANPANGDVEVVILIDDWSGNPPAMGSWTISITGAQIGDTGLYHGWMADESAVGTQQPYLSTNADNSYLVAKPGGAYHGITVGSYARHDLATRFRTSWTDVNAIGRTDTSALDQDISDFSSTGKTRDGRIKPDLTAPGERVLGAVSKDAYPGVSSSSIYRYHPFAEIDALITDDTENHAFGALQGTSFSAPVVAGLAARILSTAPTLDAIEVRNVLLNSALRDAFTGTVPNDLWGYGKAGLTVGGAPLPPSVRITTDSLPDGVVGQPYEVVLTASGGTLPYAWSVLDPLPAGLTLTGNLLHGTPTVGGASTLTLRVADSAPSQTAERDLTLTVLALPALAIETQHLPSARLSRAYNGELEASGGTPPYGWTLAGGNLPPGLSLAEGKIVGTPTAVGTYAFALKVQDFAHSQAARSFSIRVRTVSGDQWYPLGGDEPGINRITIDPNNTQHLLTATAGSAIFESWNGGEWWSPITINNGYWYDPAGIAFRPSDSMRWSRMTNNGWADFYLLMRYGDVSSGWLDVTPCFHAGLAGLDFDPAGNVYILENECEAETRLLQSVDDGENWAEVSHVTACGGTVTHGAGLTVCPSDPSILYASHNDGGAYLCRSLDGGASWAPFHVVSGAAFKVFDFAVSPDDPESVAMGINEDGFPDDRIYVEWTTDGGTQWHQTLVATGGLYAGFCLERSPADPNHLLLCGAARLYESRDGGATWSELPVIGRTVGGSAAAAFDPVDPNTYYVDTPTGLYKTVDGGQSWSWSNGGLVLYQLNGLALSRQSPGSLFAASDEVLVTRSGGKRWTWIDSDEFFFGDLQCPIISGADPNLWLVTDGFEVIRSENAGVTWTELSSTAPGSIDALDADPFDANAILAIDGTDVYRSTNRGQTWALVLDTETVWWSPVEVDYAEGLSGRAYTALGDLGIYQSSNAGQSWTQGGLNDGTHFIERIEPAPSDADYVYSSCYIYESGPEIHLFDPAVGVWQTATTPPTEQVLSLAVDCCDSKLAYAGVDHPGTASGAGGVYKTTDGGITWTRLAGILTKHDVTGLAAHPTEPGSVYAATYEGGIYHSTDAGLTWTPLDTYGTVADVVNENKQDPTNANLLFAATEGYGVHASSNKGQTYVPRVSGLGNLYVNAIAFDPTMPSTMYAATDAGIYKSTNSANTWAATALTTGEVLDLVTDNEGTAKRIWAVVKGQGVAASYDGGLNFSVYSTGLASLELTGLEIEDLGTAKRIWAVMHGGDGVAYSDDLGQTWHGAAGNGLTDRNVNDLTVESGTAKRIWAVTHSGVFYTRDDGLSWTELSLGLPSNTPVTSVVVDPNTHEALVSLFAENGGGVYRGGNVSGVWSAFNEGLDYLKVRRLTRDDGHSVDPTTLGTNYYAATAGDGVYTTELRSQTATGPTVSTASFADGYVATAYNGTLSATGGTPPYTWSLAAGSLPTGLTLAGTGNLSGAPGIEVYCSFTVRVADANLKLAEKALSIRVWERVSVSPTTLPSVQREQAYPPSQLAVSGGKSPLVWTISGGALPSGLGLSSGGLLSGTPTASGTFSFTARATDANGSYGERAFAVTITPYDEVSAPGCSVPFTLQRNLDGTVHFRWEDFGSSATGYNLYEGPLGSYGSAAHLECHFAGTSDGSDGRVHDRSVGVGNTFYLITASDASQEMSPGKDSSGNPRVIPTPCGPH